MDSRSMGNIPTIASGFKDYISSVHAASQWELMLSCWSTMAHKSLQSGGILRHCTPVFGGEIPF